MRTALTLRWCIILRRPSAVGVMEEMPMPTADGAVTHPGPADRLEVLYRAEYVPMVRLAFTLVGSNVEAEEIVQDSFVEISRHLDTLRRPGAYLRVVVVSRCRTALRRRRLMQLRAPVPPQHCTADVGTLWDVLQKLPEDQRIAVVLRYYCGFRAAEIARIVDAPASTVRSQVRRALSSMRKELTS
jgi:RNA polymerase sigma factor (sigma-70 family)